MKRPNILLRLLLLLLPRAFRADHADGIADLVEEYGRDRGPIGRAIVLARASLDVVWVAVSLRFGGLLAGGMSQDLRFAARSLRRDRALTGFAVLIVGLGIGASVSVFSVVDALLVRPLPFDEPDRLALISNGPIGTDKALSSHSVQVTHLMDLRAEANTFVDVAGYHLFDRQGDHVLMSPSGPERLTRLRVTPNFFEVLGVDMALGRSFSAEEGSDGGPRAILLTHALWTSRFASEPSVLGRNLPLDGETATIVGVLPASFDFESIFSPREGVDYVAAFPISLQSSRSGNTLALVGRLADGATIDQASAQINTIAERRVVERGDEPNINSFAPFVVPLRAHVSGSYRAAVLVLAGAVGLVMLLVCANLSNLLLARGAGREKEMAIRTAMGARRTRLVRQMIVESVALASLGAGIGVMIAIAATTWLSSLPAGVALLDSVRVDGTALAFTVVAALVTGLGFGLAPAWRSSEISIGSVLKEGSRGASQGRRHRALRDLLVVSQVALACMLLVGATLLSRSFTELVRVELGYEPRGATVLRIDPPKRFEEEDDRQAFLADALQRARETPSVSQAGLTDVLPMHFNRRWCVRSVIERERDGDCVSPYVRNVSEGFLGAMGLDLLAGRDFEDGDGPDAPKVALVNERLAERMWPGADPIGELVMIGGRRNAVGWRVVGVVRGTRFVSPEREPSTELFLPIRQLSDHNAIHLVTRAAGGDVQTMVTALGGSLKGLRADLPTRDFRSVEGIIGDALAPNFLLVRLLTAFAGFALLLAAVGIYAVITYTVGQRRRELGIRIALGASAPRLQRSVVQDSARRVLAGLILGLVASALLSRLLEGLLFGVQPLDLTTYLIAGTGIALVAMLASWLPARRATRIDPVDALGADAPAGGTA